MRISDWSSDVCSSDLDRLLALRQVPEFQPGDTVRVNVRIKEGERERVQAYEGVCIARGGKGIDESFTVSKISFGEGVERVFPVLSPMIESIAVRSDERRVGKGWVSKCKYGWTP